MGMREVEKVGLERAILHQVEAGASGLRMSGTGTTAGRFP